MNLRLRIFLACALLALLPALPVTWVVRDLLERSFTIALSEELSSGLEGGAGAARLALRLERENFREACRSLEARADLFRGQAPPDAISSLASADRLLLLNSHDEELWRRGDWTEYELELMRALARGNPGEAGRLIFPRSQDRGSLRAILPLASASQVLLISRPLDQVFLADFERVVNAQQLLAGLGLERERLRRGFVRPFLLVYLALLVISLLMAAWLSSRLTRRLALLADGARRVGEGDWNISLPEGGRDEVGRLVASFNGMVSSLDRQRRSLIELEKMAAWREMARGLAHEIKNPLTPISLVVQELRDRYPGGDESYGEFLRESGRIIDEEVESLRRLAREFSEFARTPEMNPRPGNLHALLKDLAHLYGSRPVRLDLAEDAPELPFDHEYMRRALSNLFENALAALEQSEAAEPAITVTSRVHDGALELDFADNGPGVPEHIRDRIFEPHFTTKGSGMGLGLALVHSVFSLHGGQVRLLDGPGARFRLTLPLAAAASVTERV